MQRVWQGKDCGPEARARGENIQEFFYSKKQRQVSEFEKFSV